MISQDPRLLQEGQISVVFSQVVLESKRTGTPWEFWVENLGSREFSGVNVNLSNQHFSSGPRLIFPRTIPISAWLPLVPSDCSCSVPCRIRNHFVSQLTNKRTTTRVFGLWLVQHRVDICVFPLNSVSNNCCLATPPFLNEVKVTGLFFWGVQGGPGSNADRVFRIATFHGFVFSSVPPQSLLIKVRP